VAGCIGGIRENSIAAELGLAPGDVLVSINGQPIDDVLDYQFLAQEDYLEVEIKKQDGETWVLEIDKDYDESLGIDFDALVFDRIKPCQNRCVFCFVDQLPPHVRSSLRIKDDDYRHSFINGNFITLTNLSESDWAKIVGMHLSPLYVSVHCTRSELREQMLQNRQAGSIKQDLQRLRDAGIQVHTQVVVCPGWNDGPILQETIEDLASMYPGVLSVGLVPVGLTGHREGLTHIAPLSVEAATMVIAATDTNQVRFRQQLGTGFVYAADEFYVRTGLPLPPAGYYDDYSQIENGIGLARILLDDFRELEPQLPQQVMPQQVFVISGESTAVLLQSLIQRLNQIEGLVVELITVPNRYFGGGVTVTGLLTGRDILAALGHRHRGQRVIIPDIVLRDGHDVLLDDMSVEQLKSSSGADICVAASSAAGLLAAVMDG